MNQLLTDFFNKDEVLEKEKRDAVLIECGLYTKEKQYSDKSGWGYKQDPETKRYYKIVKVPIEVTDEEYCKVLQIYRKNKATEENKERENNTICMESVNPHAERILNFIVVLRLILCFLFSAIFVFAGIGLNEEFDYVAPFPLVAGIVLAFLTIILGFVSWALQTVVINISNNLHNISRLTERIEKK